MASLVISNEVKTESDNEKAMVAELGEDLEREIQKNIEAEKRILRLESELIETKDMLTSAQLEIDRLSNARAHQASTMQQSGQGIGESAMRGKGIYGDMRVVKMAHIMDVFERKETSRNQQWKELLEEDQASCGEEPIYENLRNSDYGKNLMAINQLYRSLTNLIRPRDSLLHHMIRNDILTPNKKKLIKSYISDEDKAAALVDTLVLQPATHFEKFYKSLKDDKQSRVAQLIELYKNPLDGDVDIINMSFDVRLGFLDGQKQNRIRDNWPTLVENIDAENGLIDILFEKETINHGEKQKLANSNLTNSDKVDLILDLLMRCTNEDYYIFTEALRLTNNAHIAHILENNADGEYEKYEEPLTVYHFTREKSDKMLKRSQHGTYLIRLKSTDRYVLCCRTRTNVKHYEIHKTETSYLIGKNEFTSLEGVVNYYKERAIHKDIHLKEAYRPE